MARIPTRVTLVLAAGGERSGRVVRRVFRRYIETSDGTHRATRRFMERYGKALVLALRENRNWKRGHPRNRRRYPVPSGLRFGYRVRPVGFRTLGLQIIHDYPYPPIVERRYRRVASTDRRLRSARRRKEASLVAADVQEWLDRNAR